MLSPDHTTNQPQQVVLRAWRRGAEGRGALQLLPAALTSREGRDRQERGAQAGWVVSTVALRALDLARPPFVCCWCSAGDPFEVLRHRLRKYTLVGQRAEAALVQRGAWCRARVVFALTNRVFPHLPLSTHNAGTTA